ncbi:O-acetyl-ADP-ribose deacetylase [uncultured Enterovirga sp.]|uniref:O-acetyl-ADP-ribose deacetylase n=1 Tax=uncultured Enterovirga sp. TaxID=2026352 RepID=UPI0035CBF1C6
MNEPAVSRVIGGVTIEVQQADITALDLDAIVNAANAALAGGGGVDGAIHRGAGPALADACRVLGGCEPGDAKITPGFGLKARWVIHTVGPVWRGGTHREADVLASCYRRSLEIARENRIRSLAFPAISTGIYGFPADRAAGIAVRTLRDVAEHSGAALIVLCCFSAASALLHSEMLRIETAPSSS